MVPQEPPDLHWVKHCRMLIFAIPFLSIQIFRTCSFIPLGKYELELKTSCVKFQVDWIIFYVAPERQNHPKKADFDDVAPPLKMIWSTWNFTQGVSNPNSYFPRSRNEQVWKILIDEYGIAKTSILHILNQWIFGSSGATSKKYSITLKFCKGCF